MIIKEIIKINFSFLDICIIPFCILYNIIVKKTINIYIKILLFNVYYVIEKMVIIVYNIVAYNKIGVEYYVKII
jgi:hypothetical protein